MPGDGWTLGPAKRRSSTVPRRRGVSPEKSRTCTVLAASISTMPTRSIDENTGRQTEIAATFHDDGARRSRRRADAVVQKGERRTWRAADDRAGTAAFDDPTSELEGVDTCDRGEGERLRELIDVAACLMLETASDQETRKRRHDRFGDRDEDQDHEEIHPEVVRAEHMNPVVTSTEVVSERCEKAPEVNSDECDKGEPQPCDKPSIERARGDESLDRRWIFESIGVGEILAIDGIKVEVVGARRDRHVAHAARGRDLQDQVVRDADAEFVEQGPRAIV